MTLSWEGVPAVRPVTLRNLKRFFIVDTIGSKLPVLKHHEAAYSDPVLSDVYILGGRWVDDRARTGLGFGAYPKFQARDGTRSCAHEWIAPACPSSVVADENT